MGILGKLFGGGEPELPALDPASAAAAQLHKFVSQVEVLVGKVDDRFEVVPSEKAAYVFLGKPPGMFGLAWFLEGDKEERRNALLDAAEALFLAQPGRMASVAEVAQAAGVAKGTVYLYFPSKEIGRAHV